MTNIWLRFVTGKSIYDYVYILDYDLECDTSMILCLSLYDIMSIMYISIVYVIYDVYKLS